MEEGRTDEKHGCSAVCPNGKCAAPDSQRLKIYDAEAQQTDAERQEKKSAYEQ